MKMTARRSVSDTPGTNPGGNHTRPARAGQREHGAVPFEAMVAMGPGAYDFSSNVNPWGCSPRVKEALEGLPISLYPDPDCRELRLKLAAHEGVSPDQILCGNGASELIAALCRRDPRGSLMAYSAPTFGEYAACAAAAGLHTEVFDCRGEPRFECSYERFGMFLAERRPSLVFLCSPNNPTGQIADVAAVERLAERAAPGALVVDQAYREYAAHSWIRSPAVVRLCSMTKAYGLAGLRLGYLVGPPALLRSVAIQLPPWSVNAAAQAAGIAAVQDQEWLKATVKKRAQSSELLGALLRECGFEIVTEGAGLFTVRVDSGKKWKRRLMERGLAVRDCASFGLPTLIRISPGPPEVCCRLVEAMAEIRDQR